MSPARHRSRQDRTTAALLLFVALWPAFAAGERIELFATKARPAQDLVPVLEPLVQPGGTVTSMGNQLIVKGTEAQITTISRLLEQLDRPPTPLLIEVRTGAGANVLDEAAALAGTVSVLGDPAGNAVEGDVRGHVRSYRTQRDSDAEQFVRAVEGRPAFIAVGREIPIREFRTEIYPGAVVRRDAVEYRPATRGFYVIPWVQGDQVRLQIRQRADSYRGERQGFDVQRAETTVSGPMGEWLSLAGASSRAARDGQGPGYSAQTRGADDTEIHVRVTPVGRQAPVR
jgi:hypothetical protein